MIRLTSRIVHPPASGVPAGSSLIEISKERGFYSESDLLAGAMDGSA